ncbi:serine/threonine-protein kinase [Lentzea nigeriaca]|uniref:serine/threonine-protein kinase n=1 Tax=Lentzea nigeriaca TaxID=1128665 RepID=UPI0027DDA2D4|nr:serine/threonine-protein kinase [Lentzea nigeriaca]MBM7857378.1 serine/threonine protein kinase [Lentzea nigeriaca]
MEEKSRLIGSRYRLQAKVGQGAMGVVWQAYDEQLHRTVAAKELLALDGHDEAKVERALARAMREARLAARLEHPNAIRVYDVVEEHGQPWLIMEYLPSRSLAAVIAEQGSLPPREVARIGCYTAAALAAAHRHGIQHRDVKPGNVLIGDQEVKITDFGISRATDDGTATATGTVGTPAFFSPEVARGDEAGFPSDVFSLGATLYNAVEGTPPFGAADNHIAMLHRVASGSFMPPANAGPLLAPVLFRLLANEPERRPTMEEAVHLLAAVVNESPEVSEATAVIPATVELPVEALPEEKAKQEARPGPEAQPEPEPVPEPEPEPEPVVAPAAEPVAVQEEPPPAPVPAQPEPEEKRRKFPLVPIAIVILVLAVGVGSFLLWPKGNRNNPSASGASTAPTTSQTQSQSQPQTPPQSQTTTETPAQTQPQTQPQSNPQTNSPNPPAGPQTAQQAIEAYYALIPGDLQTGWSLLTDRFKSGRGLTFEKYQTFWRDYTGVQLSNPAPQGDNVVTVTVQYMQGANVAMTERNTYTLVQQNGKWMIDNQAP